MRKFIHTGFAILSAICMFSANLVAAADLKIGYKAEVTSADPHVLNGNNRNVWAHVYEPLVYQDERLRPTPALAVSWRSTGGSSWEFKLRPNVKFHNGAVMTAEDVKFSIERAMHLSGPRTFRGYLKDVDTISIPAPLTIQVKTKIPSPTLPDALGLIAVVPKSIGEGATEESFATGKSAIGTGPYKYVSWAHGQRVVLARNPDYWGPKEPWDNVSFQFIPREPSRVTAMLSESVDLIDGVTTNLLESLSNSKKIDTVSTTSYMLTYLVLDQYRDHSPYIKANDGSPLNKNPLRDLKVRQALMTAINREGMIKFLMKGDAIASEQLVPDGFFGHDASMKPSGNDLAKAKKLLAEAGYPDGFKMTMHCPNNRYVNDAKLCEAVAQVFNQIGIKTDVTTMPFSVYQARKENADGQAEFSVFMIGYGAVTGDSLTGLNAMIHSPDKKGGWGSINYGGYSNKQVDALIEKASQMMNEKERETLQKQAMKLALSEGAIIPLVQLNSTWAVRKGLTFKPRADGFTMAMDIREAKAAN